tara:strand:- start:47 stop:760 length:714 start_codon:yes stop_codon:yes gene_type:complete
MKANVKTPEIKIPSIRLSWLHLVLILVCIFWFRSCSINSSIQKDLSNYDKVINDTISYYETKNGDIVATKNALEGSKEALQLLLSAKNDSLKQFSNLVKKFRMVNSATNVKTITVIDSIKVPYTIDGVVFNKPFNLKEPHYTINGNSTNTGLFINDLTIPNTQSVVVGKRKTGFFKTEYKVEVQNSNPFIKTTDADAFTLKETKKRLGVGIYVGYGLNNTGLTPQLGVGLSYNVIRL